MKKTFVLDTNVILYDAEAIGRFPNHDIFLPLTVFEELNRKKKQPHESTLHCSLTLYLLTYANLHLINYWYSNFTIFFFIVLSNI